MKTSRRINGSRPSAGVLFATGTYTGDGAATQSIVGVGFQPRFVTVYPDFHSEYPIGFKCDRENPSTRALYWRRPAAPAQWFYALDMIISLDADGFTVGDGTGIGNIFNVLDTTYTYICWG